MSSNHSFPLLRQVTCWLAANILLLFTMSASAQDNACRANFTSSGDVKSGMSFAASRTIDGLSPHDALAQYKQIALRDGFLIGRETYEKQGGDLIVSQRANASSRGFDLHVRADENGKVSISTTLPTDMSIEPEMARENLCQALDRLQVGAPSAASNDTPSPGFVPTPQQVTDICVANFALGRGSEVEGQIFSTWSLGSHANVPETLEKLKGFIAQNKDIYLEASAVHGTKATFTLTLNDAASLRDRASLLTKLQLHAASLQLDMDSSLNAASLTTRLSKEQDGISKERVRRLSCTLLNMAINGAPLPEEKKESSSLIALRNPFKNVEKEEAEQKAAAQNKQKQAQDLIQRAQTLLYQRAQDAGKAIVFMPMMNKVAKYRLTPFADIHTDGGSKRQAYRFDETATLVWRATGDRDDLLQAGDQSSQELSGLFGYIQMVMVNKALYGIYIVDPGSYDLVGLTYDLDRSKLPALDSKRWTDQPKVGITSVSETQNAEFSEHKYWSDAQYQNMQVYDGSTCTMSQTGGGVTGCVGWQAQYHNETRVTDPGGWKTAVDKNYVGGLRFAITLTHPFARFDAKPGEILVTDGFVPTPDSLVADSEACKQVVMGMADCAIQKLTLFRIAGSSNELRQSFDTTARSPSVASFISRLEYRPLKVNATALKDAPDGYEAGWTTAYSATDH
nr:hypothetical protein [Dyella sp. ASV24]